MTMRQSALTGEDDNTPQRSVAARELLRCMTFIDQPPGWEIRHVRRPPSGFAGWLIRTEERVALKLRPELQWLSQIRGAKVARDYLLQALLKHSHSAEFAFTVPDQQRAIFERWAAEWLPDPGSPPVEIYSSAQLVSGDFDNLAPDIWINLDGDSSFPVRIRDRLSSKVFPTVTVQHGLSAHFYLYDRFLRTMLTPHHVCDSFVCTSLACRKALTNILEFIAARFYEEFSVNIQFKGRIDLIPLCVDTDRLCPRDKAVMRKQLGIRQDAVILLYVGYLSHSKADLTPLLPIIRNLVRNNTDVELRFVIAGTGPESYVRGLLNLVVELGLEKNVVIMREVSDSRKEQLLSAADVFVGPCDSMQESFGLTPVEAMASGLPQVVADWSGYRETVLHGRTGFLVPTIWGRCDGELRCTGDTLGWAYDHINQGQSVGFDLGCMYEKLQLLISHPELRGAMAECSRARAVAEFSYACVARRYDELWAELRSIAGRLQRPARTVRFDQPTYFGSFGHFASRVLADEFALDKGDSDLISIERLVRLANIEVPVIDESLVHVLVSHLTAAKDDPQGIRVGQLLTLVAEGKWSSDTVRRHLLFLIKHGKAVIRQYANTT
jgi:D-inositol-3-phosphate glycosyltransferase